MLFLFKIVFKLNLNYESNLKQYLIIQKILRARRPKNVLIMSLNIIMQKFMS